MEFYHKIFTTYHKDVKVGRTVDLVLCEDTPKPETHYITWGNLKEWMSKYYGITGFYPDRFKEGKRRVYFTVGKEKCIREKKEELNIRVEISYEKFTPPIQRILDWADGEAAIQYLRERNIKL